MSTSNRPKVLWQQPEVSQGLRIASNLLGTLTELAARSPNHSQKAFHVLTRAMEIIVTVQQFLREGANNLPDVINAWNSLESTEQAMNELIDVLKDEGSGESTDDLDRSVLSSWHLHRNAFTKQLKMLAETGSSTTRESWTDVMQDLVRADDLDWVDRLAETINRSADETTKASVKTIIEALEDPEALPDIEAVQEESILAIMCLADNISRPSGPGQKAEIMSVVNAMAIELKKPDGHDWSPLAVQLHSLPVCRQVEKPLLVHEGNYPISAVLEDAQLEVDAARTSVEEIIPFGVQDEDGHTAMVEVADVKGPVTKIDKAIKAATAQLKMLHKKGMSANSLAVKDRNSISYATTRLVGAVALALMPVSELADAHPSLKDSLKTIAASVDELAEALTSLKLSKEWKQAYQRALRTTASLLIQYGAGDGMLTYSAIESTTPGTPRTSSASLERSGSVDDASVKGLKKLKALNPFGSSPHKD